ncbi:MAG TPA: CHAT domain-containing protein [Ottowia sp.]|uniref:CHAT domain-containing protein n=1 Tax=Ottowia sp. TaxID=1898956 RepID=UPI002BDBD56D|nr:CHAT domain-containing protein [Ottowia sp.]HMN20116.1 CHAT domain-containing protein [Ottowia sp.]
MRFAGGSGGWWWAAVLVLAAGAAMGSASAQPAAPDAEAAAARAEQLRVADTDTLLALTSDGAVLYAQDDVKLDALQYCSQAVALAEAGEFRQSVRAASKVLHLADAQGDDNLQALARRDLAIVYSYSGQYDKAIEFARQALGFTAKEPQTVVGPANKVIGDVRMRRGDVTGAILSYEEALAGSSERYAPLVRASLANALIEAGQTQRARETLAAIAKPPEEGPLRAQIDRTEARLLLAEGKPAEARARYQALTTRSYGVDSHYFQLWAWDGVARSAQAEGDQADALAAIEQALTLVDGTRSRFRSEEFKIGLFSDLQSVFERAIDLYLGAGDARRALEVSERSRSRALLDAVRGRAALGPDASETVRVDALQAALRPDERMVEFHALPEYLQAWVIGPTSLESHQFPVKRDELTELVEVFRNQIVRGRRTAITNADKLGQALMAPLGLAPGQRVIVVPHGPLHYLPFQALRLEGQYLIERHPISVAPSAGIALRLVQRGSQAADALTAFGNPRIEDKYDLPGAEAEVSRLSRLFPQHALFTGAQATKTNFREAIAKAPLVHVAAHAQADEVDPLYSRILLANEDGRHSFLEAHEVMDMKLPRTALVTLSACESGLGRIASGDEVLGFPRAFLSAGSEALIASLWPVSDESTEVLMSTLYGALAQGRDVQQAMQAGQLAVMRQPRMAHPFFWAPFNLTGNWRLTVGG